jgi:pyruvate dehydrogenase E2 component (dihydrolipoamide acetyltransferase)
MNVEMTLPDLSTTGASVRIVRWLVKPGQAIRQGQPLVEVETDKATMEVESYLSGVLVQILADEDSEIEVGQALAILSAAGAVGSAPAPMAAPTPAPAPIPAPAPEPAPARAGMFARNRQKAAEAAPEPVHAPAPDPLALTTAQRVTAQRMLESKQNVPHFYLQVSANAEPAAVRRAAANTGIAWDAFFVCAVGRALQHFPRLRAGFRDGKLVPAAADAVGVAVDLNGDLYVCPIAGPAAKTPEQVSLELSAWVARLKQGDPQARTLQPACLTISNLGAAGVEAFSAVINPPEAAILAVGKVAPQVIARDGQVAIQQRVTLTLSVDHRVTSGRYAADFLAALVREFESM